MSDLASVRRVKYRVVAQCFDASDVVPVYFVLFTLCTVTTGMVLYLEVCLLLVALPPCAV